MNISSVFSVLIIFRFAIHASYIVPWSLGIHHITRVTIVAAKFQFSKKFE